MTASLSDFDFVLPPSLIAARPPEDRPSARLLCVDQNSGAVAHRIFRDLEELLKPGDLLVLNDTKVMPARIFGNKETGGKVEALLLEDQGEGKWEALLRPGGRIKKGAKLSFGENGTRIPAQVLDDPRRGSAERTIQFSTLTLREELGKIGHMPLPPYLNRPDTPEDHETYQTVFAEREGAVASPTAGLHFDRALLDRLTQKGIEIVHVTLHVGYGTFQSISVQDLSKHQMFEERFEITPETAEKINRARAAGRRIIACGTTSVRTLESAVDESGSIQAQSGKTRIFIYPPYEFKVVTGLITNFHLPQSTLLLLVAAFMGREKMFAAYEEAIAKEYRFYSYGDAMLIL